ncbi:hypothetical protein CEXT_670171 [Caerostris extrusa]|uniref:Uncharacterized protein n=1 Tax=Caerostris extrusa TaxID=172846 RepID=A0AAV4WH82_CAEEX|nr:hypothetical protein CEXT_670171 [Caerostris extrusa]
MDFSDTKTSGETHFVNSFFCGNLPLSKAILESRMSRTFPQNTSFPSEKLSLLKCTLLRRQIREASGDEGCTKGLPGPKRKVLTDHFASLVLRGRHFSVFCKVIYCGSLNLKKSSCVYECLITLPAESRQAPT